MELKKIVRTYPTASNLDELRRNVRAWKQLGCDTQYLTSLTKSMNKRITEVIAASVDVTKY